MIEKSILLYGHELRPGAYVMANKPVSGFGCMVQVDRWKPSLPFLSEIGFADLNERVKLIRWFPLPISYDVLWWITEASFLRLCLTWIIKD